VIGPRWGSDEGGGLEAGGEGPQQARDGHAERAEWARPGPTGSCGNVPKAKRRGPGVHPSGGAGLSLGGAGRLELGVVLELAGAVGQTLARQHVEEERIHATSNLPN